MKLPWCGKGVESPYTHVGREAGVGRVGGVGTGVVRPDGLTEGDALMTFAPFDLHARRFTADPARRSEDDPRTRCDQADPPGYTARGPVETRTWARESNDRAV
jgi:hypothetical protein